MFIKAQTFGDKISAKKILQTSNPVQAKRIGRRVKNFNETIWNKKKDRVMKFILEQKFKQHPEIFEELLATNDCIILEASPWDRYWGAGYRMDDPRILNRANWGKNMLGQLLMEIRDKYLLRCK
ncbi:N-glycosidase [Ditylenchus destructor]|uniref:N-glycosidase n=1 Tax=Ditylenchus destructor TaxID=166010 RepID=A0AAD4MP69_9BILA|nr:N-glycosidase [Ditylenchus destructor]